MSVVVIVERTRVVFDRDVDDQIADDAGDDSDAAGWWCVSTRPFPCPAAGCGFVAQFMTAAHRVVVWPESDDPRMLRFAQDAKILGRDPRVVEYQPGYGASIAYDLWVRIGRPVHGRLPTPDGWRRFASGGRE